MDRDDRVSGEKIVERCAVGDGLVAGAGASIVADSTFSRGSLNSTNSDRENRVRSWHIADYFNHLSECLLSGVKRMLFITEGRMGCLLTYVANLAETVVRPEPGPTCLSDQGKQLFSLSLTGVLGCKLFVAAACVKSQQWCGIKHRAVGGPPTVSLWEELSFEGVLGVDRV
jgi:hypothetical protein